MQAADGEIEVVLDLLVGIRNIVVEADGEIAVGEPAERVAERAEGMRLFFRRLGALGRHFGLCLGFDAGDLCVTLGFGLLALHRLVGLVARLVDRQHLEALHRVRYRADLVLALKPGRTTSKSPPASLSMAPRIAFSGPVTRRDTRSIMPPATTSASTRRPDCTSKSFQASADCAAACALAASSAAMATPSVSVSLLTELGDHCSTVKPVGSPAINCLSTFSRSSG